MEVVWLCIVQKWKSTLRSFLFSPKLEALLSVRLCITLAPKKLHLSRKSWALFFTDRPLCFPGWSETENKRGWRHKMTFEGASGEFVHTYLDDFMLHDRVRPFDEGLHCGVLPQQLLQLLKDGNGVICRKKPPVSESSISIMSPWGRLSISLTLGVDVWVLVPSRCYTEQRLRADAAQIYVVDIQHHVGHHRLVKQCRTSYLHLGRDKRRPEDGREGTFTCDHYCYTVLIQNDTGWIWYLCQV